MATPDVLRPTLAQVGAMLRARTRDPNGVEQGTFTPETRPTDVQANELIDLATDTVRASVGNVPPGSRCEQSAYVAAAYGACCLIEKSYFPEQIASDRSAYALYRDEYKDALEGLATCLGVNLPADSPGGAVSYEWGQVAVGVAGIDAPGIATREDRWRPIPEEPVPPADPLP